MYKEAPAVTLIVTFPETPCVLSAEITVAKSIIYLTSFGLIVEKID
jgi:hypothetical protein